MRIYAIGDVHGRDDLLAERHVRIRADLAARPVDEPVVVHLGDYIDRGPRSRAVIERLMAMDDFPARCICLYGNHEDEMLGFLKDPEYWSRAWFSYGGLETMANYGISADQVQRSSVHLVRDWLESLVPPGHLDFMRRLPRFARFGDYLFVHAGIRPGIPFDRQEERDLIWIREPFLESDADFGFVVVHGHTPNHHVVIRRNRIGIDTLAFQTGNLTCLVLEGDKRQFL